MNKILFKAIKPFPANYFLGSYLTMELPNIQVTQTTFGPEFRYY